MFVGRVNMDIRKINRSDQKVNSLKVLEEARHIRAPSAWGSIPGERSVSVRGPPHSRNLS